MNIPFLDLSRMDVALKNKLSKRFAAVLDQGLFSGGKEVMELEESVGEYLKSRFSIPCANGTDALELALRALEIGPGDEVIVPALTWVSTAEAVVMVGAKPIFWDTDQEGLIREDWEMAVTSKTKAVIPVHLYGKMVDMEGLTKKAKSLGVQVIEDAAQAFGSFQDGKAAGTWGEIGCLSFYPTKNLGALGEAGMCLTQNEELAQNIRLLLNHGQSVRDQHELIGKNSRIDTLQAAFLNVFLEGFEVNQKRRKVIAKRYLDVFSSIEELSLPSEILEEKHNAHLFVIRSKTRNELKTYLAKMGVGSAIHYPKILPDMIPFKVEGDFFQSRRLSNEGLSFPLNPYLSDQEVTYIIDAVRGFFKG
jgi:UDP-2-acetamido-2-deoxy-ribo-hexuluronate aminotransferase